VRHVDTCGLDTSLTGPPNNAIPLPTPSNDALSSNWWARPPRLRSTKSACSAGCGKLTWALAPRSLWATQFFLQIAIRRRADERTRTADLLITSWLAANLMRAIAYRCVAYLRRIPSRGGASRLIAYQPVPTRLQYACSTFVDLDRASP
jgi:hypothetical protein